MPDPNTYKKMNDFMAACMSETKAEGLNRNARVGKCLGMWRGRNKKKKVGGKK